MTRDLARLGFIAVGEGIIAMGRSASARATSRWPCATRPAVAGHDVLFTTCSKLLAELS